MFSFLVRFIFVVLLLAVGYVAYANYLPILTSPTPSPSPMPSPPIWSPPSRKEEVFNVSRNIYPYRDAKAVCKAFGARLANYDDLIDAYRNGADWCNYGWSENQMALYPTSKATWEKLAKGPVDKRELCGRPGVNGGYFTNPELRFGVNCYGVKPSPTSHNQACPALDPDVVVPDEEMLFARKVNQFRQSIDMAELQGFTPKKWSEVGL